MDQITSVPQVSGVVFQGLSNLLNQSKVAPCSFYKNFGLSPNVEHNLAELVPFSTFVDILHSLKRHLRIAHPSLALSKIQLEIGNSPYIELVSQAPSIDVAMQLGQRFRHAYSEVTYWNSYITGDVAVIRRQSFVPLEMSDREHCLYAVSFMYRLYKKFHGENARVIGISLIQPSEADNSIDSFFECPISYGQDFDGFTLHIDDYYKPNKSFCVKTYQTLLSKLANHHVFFPETRLFSTTVKSLIAQTLSTGEITLHDVANMVGISSSAVKKRLKKENCTFSDLLIDVRLNVAKRLLIQPDIPLTNIAAMLGYSEASSFSRAFNALEQQSPREWRKKNIP